MNTVFTMCLWLLPYGPLNNKKFKAKDLFSNRSYVMINYDSFCLFSGPDKCSHCCEDCSSSLATHVRAKSSLTLQQSLGSFVWIDVGPRGRDMDWSQVSQGKHRSTAPYCDYYLHCCSWRSAQHLSHINSPFPLSVIYVEERWKIASLKSSFQGLDWGGGAY